MKLFKKSIAVTSAVLIVGGIATVGFSGFASSGTASGQITGNESMFMTFTKYGTTTNLNWGPGAPLAGPFCANILSHAIQVSDGTEGNANVSSIGSTGAGAGKVTFNPLVFTKQIDTATAPYRFALAAGTLFNVQLTFFHPIGANPIDCSKPDMIVSLVGVLGQGDSIQYAGGGGATETVTLAYGLEAIRTASINSSGVWAWDAGPGFCWDRVKNLACNALIVPTNF